MIRVIIESPYAGGTEKNMCYLRACMRDCLKRGEAPFASHGLYTQPGVLCDEIPVERDFGINAGFAWREVSEKTVVYTDLGISTGMRLGMAHAQKMGHRIEYRELGDTWIQGLNNVSLEVEKLRVVADELDQHLKGAGCVVGIRTWSLSLVVFVVAQPEVVDRMARKASRYFEEYPVEYVPWEYPKP